MTVFTNEKFTGYTFNCTSESANVGFYHVCVVKDSNDNEVLTSKVHYINRTWESYQYQSVFEQAKSELQNKLDGVNKEEYDIDFLNRLVEEYHITDFGELENGELVIMFDSWSQVKGEDEREYVEGEGMVKTGKFIKSVYAKLVDLAEKDLLKPSINRTIKEVEFVFTDSYAKCDECGRIFSTEYGELTFVESEYQYLCDDCLNDGSHIEALIEEAKEDFNKAIKVGINDDLIEELGYEKLDSEKDFSTRMSQWGEASWGCYDTPIEQVEDLCKTYGGFAKLTGVHQFDAEYTLYFPSETVDLARAEFGLETEEV